MLLKTLIPVVVYASIVLADGASIIAAMSDISKATIALNTTVAAWTGKPLRVIPITIESASLLLKLNEGKSVAEKSANLSITEALAVAGATTALAGTVKSTLATIEGKKRQFQKLLLQPLILVNLLAEKKATDEFAAAIVQKVPESLQAIAAGLTKPIDDAFDAAISSYESF